MKDIVTGDDGKEETYQNYHEEAPCKEKRHTGKVKDDRKNELKRTKKTEDPTKFFVIDEIIIHKTNKSLLQRYVKAGELLCLLRWYCYKTDDGTWNRRETYHEARSCRIDVERNSLFQVLSTKMTTAERYTFHENLLPRRPGHSSTIDQSSCFSTLETIPCNLTEC